MALAQTLRVMVGIQLKVAYSRAMVVLARTEL